MKTFEAIELEDFLNNDFLDQLDTIEIASEKWLLIIFYTLFLLFGFAANCLVIVVLITSHKELQFKAVLIGHRSLFGKTFESDSLYGSDYIRFHSGYRLYVILSLGLLINNH